MQSMFLDETQCLTSGDPWQHKKDVAKRWAKKRLNELSEGEKIDFYSEIIISEKES